MAGIYLHIPFCKQACHYCDFHFSTSLGYREEVIKAMHEELKRRRDYLPDKKIDSIYFGGGTPSILKGSEIQRFIDQIANEYDLMDGAEITLEANPDDLEAAQVKELRATQVNRFSIGIQSFFEEDLRWMNRAHNASQADSAIKRVQDAGFENITIDLIYGFPLLTDLKWRENILKTMAFDIPHISAYAMTVEQKTALGHFVKKGKQPPMNEQQASAQFIYLMESLMEKGYEHYEISNFAIPGRYSRHNTSYWQGTPYLGIGPSAHSFDGEARQWNISNNHKYTESIINETSAAETEHLTKDDKYNEYIMTRLRTIWGVDLTRVEQEFGYDYLRHTEKMAAPFIEKGWLKQTAQTISLSREGKLFADHIASELFVVD